MVLIDIYETIELDLNLFQYIIKVKRHDALGSLFYINMFYAIKS